MLNFLRNLRRKNMNSKYFKYAVGEIVLVVIGILIALSINNWNENRKDRKFEESMLGEIRGALIQDSVYFHYLIQNRINFTDSVNEVITTHFLTHDTYDKKLDSIIGYLDYGFLYQYNNGPFESFKNSGLDKIKDPALRAGLTYIYDFSLPRTKELLGYGGGFNTILSKVQEYVGSRLYIKDGKIYDSEYLRNPNELDKMKFLEFLNFNDDYLDNARLRLEGRLVEIRLAINRIDEVYPDLQKRPSLVTYN